MKDLKICGILFLFALTGCASFKTGKKNYQPASRELYNTIFHMDSVLFQAFNTCAVEKFTGLLNRDLEFYHDQSGLMVSAETQAQGLKTRCAEQGRNGILRRELVRESLEVYPLKNYGAVEIGIHRFYRKLPGEKERLTTVAKFMNIWQLKNGNWTVARIVSYDHEEIE
jgi:hypothetical protein